MQNLIELQHADCNSLGYLAQQYQQIHEDPNRYRGKLQPYLVKHIGLLVKKHNAKRLLDYGSGKGHQYTVHKQHLEWGVPYMPVCFDPGFAPFKMKPSGLAFDGVICTDVMEHIPPAHVKWVLRDVLCFAKKFVLFCIFLEPAKATLPDGRNAHLALMPAKAWVDAIENTMWDLHPGKIITRAIESRHAVLRNRQLEVAIITRTRADKHFDCET